MSKLDPNTWIASLDLGPRTRGVLRNFGIYDHRTKQRIDLPIEKVSDITLYPRNKFVEQPNCGEYVMKQLDAIMETFGLTYADGRPPVLLTNTATLRDQFAMAALTGLLANPKLAATAQKRGPSWFHEAAWEFADDMMEKRK